MGVEAEILAQPKVRYFCTDFNFGKGTGHDIHNRDDSFNTFASGLSFSDLPDSDTSTCSDEKVDNFLSSGPSEGHVIRNRDDSFNTFASGLSFTYSADSDISTCSENRQDNVFSSRPPASEGASPVSESLAKTLEKSLGLNNYQADNADALNDELKGKLIITKHRPKIPDCIATDDEDWEPPVWHAWDKWDQKVNAQEDWTWHNTLKYKAKKGQFDDHDKVYKKKSKKRRHHHKSSPSLPLPKKYQSVWTSR